MKTVYFWLSYDLGLKGDYQGLYYWLDSHQAKECGDSFAFIQNYSYSDNLREEIRLDLEKNVEFKKTDRIYIVMNGKGFFVKGRRKNEAPWDGFGTSTTTTTTEDGPIQ